MKKLIKKLCMKIAQSDKLSKIFYATPLNKIMFRIHSWSCNKYEYRLDLFTILEHWYNKE